MSVSVALVVVLAFVLAVAPAGGSRGASAGFPCKMTAAPPTSVNVKRSQTGRNLVGTATFRCTRAVTAPRCGGTCIQVVLYIQAKQAGGWRLAGGRGTGYASLRSGHTYTVSASRPCTPGTYRTYVLLRTAGTLRASAASAASEPCATSPCDVIAPAPMATNGTIVATATVECPETQDVEVHVRLEEENAGGAWELVRGFGSSQPVTGGKEYTFSSPPSCGGPGSYRTVVTLAQRDPTRMTVRTSDPVDLTCSP